MRVIVSDTSPIRYLVLIGEVDLLQALYRRVLIPEAVQSELQMPQTPAPVKAWLASAPAWIEVASPRDKSSEYAASTTLGPGERGFVKLRPALERLLATNFRVHPNVVRRLLPEDQRH